VGAGFTGGTGAIGAGFGGITGGISAGGGRTGGAASGNTGGNTGSSAGITDHAADAGGTDCDGRGGTVKFPRDDDVDCSDTGGVLSCWLFATGLGGNGFCWLRLMWSAGVYLPLALLPKLMMIAVVAVLDAGLVIGWLCLAVWFAGMRYLTG
jgi:hypothetical protein